MIKIMFVCHGNICRSPMAEFIFKDLVEKHSIRDIAIPLLGCGLDKLDWEIVRKIIHEEFKDTDCTMIVCHNPKQYKRRKEVQY